MIRAHRVLVSNYVSTTAARRSRIRRRESICSCVVNKLGKMVGISCYMTSCSAVETHGMVHSPKALTVGCDEYWISNAFMYIDREVCTIRLTQATHDCCFQTTSSTAAAIMKEDCRKEILYEA